VVPVSKPTRKSSNRSKHAAGKPNSAIQTQAAELPTEEVANAPPKRQYAKNAKSKRSSAAKDTATVPVSEEAPHGQVHDIHASVSHFTREIPVQLVPQLAFVWVLSNV